MVYHIDTILLWDSFRGGGECPLCAIRSKCERDFVDSALGGSVMEPDRRIEVNKKGFCTGHMTMLYAGESHLGLALMMHTHMREVMAGQKPLNAKLREQISNYGKSGFFRRLFAGKSKSENMPATGHNAIINSLSSVNASCFICSRLDTAMERYVANSLTLYAQDDEFKKAFRACNGFCMPHYADMLAAAKHALHGKSRTGFISDIIALQESNMDRMDKELEWYTLKHDYRNKEKPWGTSKDALERSLKKMRGWNNPRSNDQSL